jgi:ribokinase
MRVHVLGSVNLDRVFRVETLPRAGETVLATTSSSGPGGKGANQAKAAARFGAETLFHGAVGADGPGEALRRSLAEAGVGVEGLEIRDDAATGRAEVVVAADGENMIVVDPGANRLARFAPQAEGAAVYLAQLEVPAPAAAAMFRSAAPGSVRILNAAPAAPEGRALLPLLDILVVNRRELAAYAGAGLEPAGAARSLIRRDDQIVVVTLGAEGALAVGPTRTIRVPGRTARVVDTTGAGDCFVGVFAAALAEGLGLERALGLANLAASLSVEVEGADAAPARAAVEARERLAPAG